MDIHEVRLFLDADEIDALLRLLSSDLDPATANIWAQVKKRKDEL
jgi:hypothetical protein